MIFLLSSCDAFYRTFPPPESIYVKRDKPLEKEIIYEKVYIQNDNGNLKAVAGGNQTKEVTFTSFGQEYIFKKGETIAFNTSGIDFAIATFEYESIENSDNIIMRLVDKDRDKVKLEKKCQTIVRTGDDIIPKIELAENLSPEQVIVTPLFDDNCNKIGYEIRYGSTDSGCRNIALKNLKRFQDCKKPPTPPTTPCNDASLCRKLGLQPCCTK